MRRLSLLRFSLLPIAFPRPLSPRVPFAPRLFLSSLGRTVDTPLQTPSLHADTSGLVAPASRGLAHRRGPTFAAGVDGKTSQMCWYRGVIRQRRPLLLPSVFPFGLDRTARQVHFDIFNALT